MSTLEELLKPRPEDVFGVVQISMDPGGWKELPVNMLEVIKGMVRAGADIESIDVMPAMDGFTWTRVFDPTSNKVECRLVGTKKETK